VETEQLIDSLTETVRPVRRLRSPLTRALAWLSIGAAYIALVVWVVSPRADLFEKISEWRFLLEQLGALGTGVAAAIAAFATTIPGYSRKVLLLPIPPLAIWLGTLGLGCLGDWLEFGLRLEADWLCFPAIAMVGLIPAIGMVVMLRRGAPLMPTVTVALGGLAAAGLGDFGLRLFHVQDAALMVLVWQVGSVFVFAALAACAGRYVLNWGSVAGHPR
jgi:hypothetical protein